MDNGTNSPEFSGPGDWPGGDWTGGYDADDLVGMDADQGDWTPFRNEEHARANIIANAQSGAVRPSVQGKVEHAAAHFFFDLVRSGFSTFFFFFFGGGGLLCAVEGTHARCFRVILRGACDMAQLRPGRRAAAVRAKTSPSARVGCAAGRCGGRPFLRCTSLLAVCAVARSIRSSRATSPPCHSG